MCSFCAVYINKLICIRQSAIEKMESIWLRPSNVPYPKVWLEFTAKESKNSDRQIKYWVQDLPEDRFDDAIQHLNTVFLHNAPLSKFFGIDSLKMEKNLF